MLFQYLVLRKYSLVLYMITKPESELPMCRRKSRTVENIAAADIILSEQEIAEVGKVLEDHPVKGGRYFEGPDEKAYLWG